MSSPTLKVGQLVELSDGRTGHIRFLGETSFSAGDWIGVEFDEPSGKNDGSVQGERYFDCDPGHGMFLRPTGVGRVLEEPKPKPAARPAAKPAPAASAAAKRTSVMANGVKSARQGSVDLSAAKRQSMNAASPTPAPRVTATMNGHARTPSKLGAKPLSTATSTASSRGATPSLADRTAKAKTAVAPRTSLASTASRTSAAPPATSRTSRPSISSTTTARTSTATRPSTTSRTSTGVTSSTSHTSTGPSTNGVSKKDLQDHDPLTESQDEDETNDPDEELVQDTPKANGHAKAPVRPVASKAASSSTPIRGTQSTAAAKREIEDLQTKLQVLEKQRDSDRDKLKALESVKTERDRFEGIISKLQTKLKPQQEELAELRKQLKESQAKLDAVETAEAEHESSMEMATLDREMAEEMAEGLRTELDAMKQKAEELELEVDVLREENGELGKEMSPEERTSQGWLQIERSNERLREALLRLRDMTQAQEEELKDQISSLEEDLKELGSVKEQYEEAQEKLKQSELAVENIKQQLDAALGAEEMLEEITEKNLALNEHIEELKMGIADLEDLKELNDELELNHVEAEKQMQDELDFKDSILADQTRHTLLQEEKIADYELTVSKFRELVTNLQSHIEDLRASQQITEAEAEELNSRSKAMTDLNLKLQSSAAKTQTSTLDLELRRLEAQEAVEHLAIVQMFLPDSYNSERDSVMAYLKFRRCAAKAKLLHQSLKERLSVDSASKNLSGAFVCCDVLDKLIWIAAMCNRFVNNIGGCSLEKFAKFEGAVYELEPVERGLNNYLEAMKRNDLQETQVADELQRTMALLTHLAEVHLSEDDLESYADDVLMRTTLMQNYLENTATALGFTKTMIPLKEKNPEQEPSEDDTEDSLTDLVSQFEAVISHSRSAKVIAGKAIHSMTELKSRFMSVSMESLEQFEQCQNNTSDLAVVSRQLGEHVFKVTNEEFDDEIGLRAALRSALNSFTAPVLEGSTTQSLLPALELRLRIITMQLNGLSSLTSDLSKAVEFERGSAPWILRAEELKATKLVSMSTEEELKRLKDDMHEKATQLRIRDQTLEEQSVKIELLESRTRDANAKANKITELQRALEATRAKEKELSTTLQTQLRDVHVLRSERDHWKTLADERSATLATDGTATPTQRAAAVEGAVATAREMDTLRDEIAGLQGAVRFLRDENRRTRLAQPSEAHMLWLTEPLTHKPSSEKQARDAISREGGAVLAALLDVVLDQDSLGIDLTALPDNKLTWRPAKAKSVWRVARQHERWELWDARREAVVRKGRELQRMLSAEEQERALEHSKLVATLKPAAKPRAAAFDSGVVGLGNAGFATEDVSVALKLKRMSTEREREAWEDARQELSPRSNAEREEYAVHR